jgi:uncharacterized protein Usg
VTVPSMLPADRYRLTTAEITYRLPDHPLLLQTYIWQKYDIAPDFPVLHQFLDFWRENLEGKLHSVRVGLGQARKHSFPLMLLPESNTRH